MIEWWVAVAFTIAGEYLLGVMIVWWLCYRALRRHPRHPWYRRVGWGMIDGLMWPVNLSLYLSMANATDDLTARQRQET